jgi:hypothetical protein
MVLFLTLKDSKSIEVDFFLRNLIFEMDLKC